MPKFAPARQAAGTMLMPSAIQSMSAGSGALSQAYNDDLKGWGQLVNTNLTKEQQSIEREKNRIAEQGQYIQAASSIAGAAMGGGGMISGLVANATAPPIDGGGADGGGEAQSIYGSTPENPLTGPAPQTAYQPKVNNDCLNSFQSVPSEEEMYPVNTPMSDLWGAMGRGPY